MINRMNNQTTFGALHEHSSFKALGQQGQDARNAILPILRDKFAQDCDIYLASRKDPETGKNHLLVLATALREFFAPDNFTGSIFLKSSRSPAINPKSLLTNVAEARISVLGQPERRAEEYEQILADPKFVAINKDHNERYEISPNELKGISQDCIEEPEEQFLENWEPSTLTNCKEL